MNVHRCRYAVFSMRLDNDEDDEDGEVVSSQLGWRYCRAGTIVRRGRKRNGTAGSIDETTGFMTETAVEGCGKRGDRRKQEERRRRRSGTLRFLTRAHEHFARAQNAVHITDACLPAIAVSTCLSTYLSTPRMNIHPERARNE